MTSNKKEKIMVKVMKKDRESWSQATTQRFSNNRSLLATWIYKSL